jgi:iron complex outermembrane receptor protein
VFNNNGGAKNGVQTEDKVTSDAMLVFGQAELDLPAEFFLTVGGSINFLNYDFKRFQPAPFISHEKKFNAEFLPRIALLKKLSRYLSIYANVSRGFSPPSLAEVRPSGNTFNNDLKAETGTNYELGIRGGALGQKISYDLTAYDFRLNETIVPRHLADGAEYFINAGKTNQRGIEALVSFNFVRNATGFVSDLKLFNSYSYNHYRFDDYRSDVDDFSGNKLTGIPPTVNMTGLDIAFLKKYYLNLTSNYVDHVPLNDSNTAFSNEYFLVGARGGYKAKVNKNLLEIFVGIDNAFDRTYSLGNDLNAIGGRYYNAAAGRNYFVGARLDLSFE